MLLKLLILLQNIYVNSILSLNTRYFSIICVTIKAESVCKIRTTALKQFADVGIVNHTYSAIVPSLEQLRANSSLYPTVPTFNSSNSFLKYHHGYYVSTVRNLRFHIIIILKSL